MYKEKKKLFIFSVLGLITSLVGVSYAFFKASVMGSESNSTIYGVAANLTIEFREGTSQISASDIFPGWSETKTFYIKNNNSAEGEYSLKLFDVENGFMEESISFEITSTNDGASIEKRNLPASDELLEPVIVIAGNTTQEYTVKVYYNNLDVDQSADLGQSFTFKIGIDKAGYEMTNLIVNGDFSDGANGWSKSMSKEPLNDAEDWIGEVCGSKACFFTEGQNKIFQYYVTVPSHKVYVKTNVNVQGYGDDKSAGFHVYNIDETVAAAYVFAEKDALFEDYDYSLLYTATAEEQYLSLGRTGLEYDMGYSFAGPLYYSKVLVVDLTETFGSGNEPTKEWCDANIEWFDGTTIINK